MRFPDGRRLFTAPCGIRTKFGPSGRRAPLYFNWNSNKSLWEMISNDYSWSMNHGELSMRENQRMVSDGILFSWINIQVAFLLRMTHTL